MRVGVWISPTKPSDGGGFTIQDDIFDALAKYATNTSHEFRIFCHPTFADQKKDAINSKNVKLEPIFTPSIIDRAHAAVLRECPRMSRFISRKTWADRIFSAHNVDFVWFVSAHPMFTEFPYATVVWDLQHRLQPFFPEVTKGGEWFKRDALYSWFLQRAAYVVVGNNAGCQELQKFYQIASERIAKLAHPTPNFVLDGNTVEADDGVLDKHSLRGKRYLFYPAQFWPHKNHYNLLKAHQLLLKSGMDIELVLSGSNQGNYDHVVEIAKSLEISNKVHFLGFVSKEELKSLYINAVALTYVSYFGPENLPPLEAFALKCPVVASNVSGSEEQLGDAAQKVDPSSPEDIARGIRIVMEDKGLREAMIARGFKITNAWTGKEYVNAIFNLLDSFQNIRMNWPNSQSRK